MFGHAAQGHASLLGLNHSTGLAIDEQQIVARPGRQAKFAYSHSQSGLAIKNITILDDPAGIGQ
ncbi:hypothetical protein D9M69_619700 [compost metagenome]